MSALIETKDLVLSLPDMTRKPLFGPAPRIGILKNINLSIPEGTILGIVGESGSGKTTLGRALMRLNRPDSGSIRFDGRDITQLSDQAMRPLRRSMQMIFQDPLSSLNPRQNVAALVVAPLLAQGAEANRNKLRQRANEALERVGLDQGFLHRYPHELSGGQRQRVGIARAIIGEPRFILADEIVSGLDVSTQAQVLALLAALQRDLKLTMAFISHDLSVVRRLCDRVIVMRRGEVVEDQPSANLFAAPSADYTKALLAAIPLPVVDRDWLKD
jgi:ABC-type oligopeptide transport system ATPase subunit